MNEPEYEAFNDPRNLIEDGKQAMAERKRDVLEALTATSAPDVTTVTEDELEDVVDAIAERVLQRLRDDADRSTASGELETVLFSPDARAQRKREVLDSLSGRRPVPLPSGPSSFDGGVREMSVRRPETHEQTLIKILRSREGDVGRWL